MYLVKGYACDILREKNYHWIDKEQKRRRRKTNVIVRRLLNNLFDIKSFDFGKY
jgi:hypothetical protein